MSKVHRMRYSRIDDVAAFKQTMHAITIRWFQSMRPMIFSFKQWIYWINYGLYVVWMGI